MLLRCLRSVVDQQVEFIFCSIGNEVVVSSAYFMVCVCLEGVCMSEVYMLKSVG